MTITFFGTAEFAVPVLKSLHENHELVAVVTVPDQPVGRKKTPTAPPVKEAAQRLGVPVHQPASLKEFIETFKLLNPDLAVVAAYGKLIPEELLSIPKHGFLCVHPSLLPKYRGPSPIQAAIQSGEEETGVTIMLLDKEMDHGPILSTATYVLRPDVYLKEAETEIWQLGATFLMDTIPAYISGDLKPVEQDHGKATYTKLLDRKDGHIDWSRSCEEIYNQIRALNLNPGTWTTWREKVLNIKSVEPTKGPSTKPGLVSVVDNEIVVGTGTCNLVLKTVQLEGKAETDARSFITGYREFVNSTLE